MTSENASFMTTTGCKKALCVAFSTVCGAGAVTMQPTTKIRQLKEELAVLEANLELAAKGEKLDLDIGKMADLQAQIAELEKRRNTALDSIPEEPEIYSGQNSAQAEARSMASTALNSSASSIEGKTSIGTLDFAKATDLLHEEIEDLTRQTKELDSGTADKSKLEELIAKKLEAQEAIPQIREMSLLWPQLLIFLERMDVELSIHVVAKVIERQRSLDWTKLELPSKLHKADVDKVVINELVLLDKLQHPLARKMFVDQAETALQRIRQMDHNSTKNPAGVISGDLSIDYPLNLLRNRWNLSKNQNF